MMIHNFWQWHLTKYPAIINERDIFDVRKVIAAYFKNKDTRKYRARKTREKRLKNAELKLEIQRKENLEMDIENLAKDAWYLHNQFLKKISNEDQDSFMEKA